MASLCASLSLQSALAVSSSLSAKGAQACPQSASCTSLSASRTSRSSVAARVAVNNAAAKAVDEAPAAAAETAAPEPAPSQFEIQSLLMELCDETGIAEVKLKMGKFRMHVKRHLGQKSAPAPVFYPPSAPTMLEDLAAVAPAAAAPPPSSKDEEPVDEGLLYVTSPAVGLMRRGRLVKGNRGRDLVEVGSDIKSGQVVAYIEQLSNDADVQSSVTGEIVEFLFEDGAPVGYGDNLMAVRPSFPGIR